MYVFVSEDITQQLLHQLEEKFECITIEKDARLYPSIASHPDIRILPIEQQLFIDSLTFKQLKLYQKLKEDELHCVTVVDVPLTDRYPATVFLNGAYKEGVFVHHRDYTHPLVRTYLEEQRIQYLHTNQGYARCCLLQLDQKHAITSDEGMARRLKQEGIEVLTIRQGHIHLEGQDYGFIGGASGVVGRTVYFNGDLKQHPDYHIIEAFIKKQRMKISDCPGTRLTDIGSILFWEGCTHDNK